MAIQAVPAITAIPPFPGLGDRALGTYNSKAFAFGTHMATTFNNDIIAIANNVKNNAEEAFANAVLAQTSGDLVTQAQAAANFKGNWSALTGALNMPASVAAFGDFWALNTNTTNVTADVPGTSSKWTRLRNGPGGSTEGTAGLTLTSMSTRVHSFAMSSADQVVTLPSAFNITMGGEIFFIENSGTLQFIVRNNVGDILVTLDPGQGAMFYLVSNTTQGGKWSVRMTEGPLSHTIYQATGVNINAASSNGTTLLALSATTALLAYRVSNNLWAVALTISGTTVTPGVPYDLGNCGPDLPSLTFLTATTAVIGFTLISTLYASARHLTVVGSGSGATISPGAISTMNAVASYGPVVCTLSTTQVLIAYNNSSNNVCARTLSLSGTTLTPNTEATIRAGSGGQGQSVVTMTGTQALLVSAGNSGGTMAHTLNVSSGLVTAGTMLTVNSAETYYPSLVGLSSTQAMIAQIGGNGEVFNARVLTVSGTDVTAGALTGEHHPTNTGSNPTGRGGLAKLSANRIMTGRLVPGVGGPTTRAGRVQMFGIQDGECIPGKDSVLKASYGDAFDLIPLTSTKVLGAYTQASGFVQVRVLEIAA